MPYKKIRVAPDKFLEYKGVVIYCTYKDDYKKMAWDYTTNINYDDVEGIYVNSAEFDFIFDVRELPNWNKNPLYNEAEVKEAIKEAVDRGIVTAKGISIREVQNVED